MNGDTRARASAVLAALADLSPTSEARATSLAISTEWFRWLPLSSLFLFGPGNSPSGAGTAVGAAQRFLASRDAAGVIVDRKFGDRLAAVDQVRSEQHSLRLGWLFVAGQMEADDGKRRRVLHPLVTMPVRVHRAPEGSSIIGAGDAELSPLIADDEVRRQLEANLQYGGGALDGLGAAVDPALLVRLHDLNRFAAASAAAAGFDVGHPLAGADLGPDELMAQKSLSIVAGVAVYAVQEASVSSRASSLRAWSESRPGRWTAFHSLYLPGEADDVSSGGDEGADGDAALDSDVDSPFLLTPVQRRAVLTSRQAPLTLVSGAPGTGKSHAIAAIACDAVARGDSVLVAAKSEATVDALLELLERSPGPQPVVFGSTERRRALADRLAAGQSDRVANARLDRLHRDWRIAVAHRREAHLAVATRLWAVSAVGATHPLTAAARHDAPGLFAPAVDLDEVDTLCRNARVPATGWWSRRRRRRSVAKLRRLAGALPDVGVERIAGAVETVRMTRAAAALSPVDEVTLPALWPQLASAGDQARDALGRWLEADSRSARRLDRASRSAIAALATALRSGRSARRDQLAKLQGDHITEALPLWVGTLADIDDLLPPDAALFDLVVLDEASSIDQPLAATALLRGARAVVAGDPRPQRQVSFVSDAQHAAAVAAHGLDADPALAGRLDVRRNSAFDLAAGAAPVLLLDEHFRSDPHLVEFVAQRIYGGRVQVATRSPRTESTDCVHVLRLSGTRDKAGVVGVEVEAAVAEARRHLPAGSALLAPSDLPSVGIVTPFRAQADALEAAALAAFTADELEALDLRIGTAHSFQGNERDVVIVSVGLGADDGANSWRFVEDPHLFAVLMTRARRRLVVVVSADPPAGGLVEAYLAQADAPPGRPRSAAAVSPWTAALAAELVAGGIDAVTAYPSGRHIIDIVTGDADRAVGIECQVHPEGPDAHIERHLSLRRHGWELHDAFESAWGDRRGELVVDLLGRIAPSPHPPGSDPSASDPSGPQPS